MGPPPPPFPSFALAPPLKVTIFTPPNFLRQNIKDGRHNNTNINKQLSPAQNTPAL